MSNNLNYIKKSQLIVKEFEDKKDPEILNGSFMELQKVNLKKERDIQSTMQVRAAALLQWFNLLQIIDDHTDPSFDINKGIPLKVMPPEPTKNSKEWPGGNDPKTLADMKKATDENNKKVEARNMQISFSRLNQHITPLVKTFIHKNYTGLPTDQAELKATIEKNLKNPARKDDFLKLLITTPIIKR